MIWHGRRLRGGGTNVALLAANYGFAALYNDSNIGHILRVLYWLVGTGTAANAVAFFNQGTVGTLVGRGIALFSGEQDMAGQIYSGTNTTAPPFGLFVGAQGTVVSASTPTPWFYVRPGFSLVFKSDTVNLALNASFWWEDLEMSWLKPEELM